MDTRFGIVCLCLFTFSFLQCGENSSGGSLPKVGLVQQKTLNPDSLRSAYQERMARFPHPMPTQQVIETGKIYPVDEAPLDTTFFLFREALLDAIDRLDVLYLLDICDEDIKSGFGGEDRLPQFVEAWGLDKDANGSQVWTVLADVLRRGGVFTPDRRRFVAPYTFPTFPDEYDAFTHGVITGAGVRLREKPASSSSIVTSLSYDIVQKAGENNDPIFETVGGEEHPWIPVQTLAGKTGYVYGKYFVSPLSYRAGFERRPNGSWKMIFLVAGD